MPPARETGTGSVGFAVATPGASVVAASEVMADDEAAVVDVAASWPSAVTVTVTVVVRRVHFDFDFAFFVLVLIFVVVEVVVVAAAAVI